MYFVRPKIKLVLNFLKLLQKDAVLSFLFVCLNDSSSLEIVFGNG